LAPERYNIVRAKLHKMALIASSLQHQLGTPRFLEAFKAIAQL